ncbi:ISL3 family transposase (plasmid) [Paucilactobacillus suebicus]|uniref:ISL3 family transposase n=1 Tax=Lactobacillaceae TaxID=33958 RepID=UPI0006F01DCD|nr:ISL3 family transposase [Secundilactobacillus malefermentans]KRM54965.1 ISL3 family transposase ISLasa4c [Secundilactobacillus malefermentans DSM 5705 = KCTC 3548]
MNDCIRKALGITDPRIELDEKEKYRTVMTDKGQATLWFCKLTYPLLCPNCHELMNKNGMKVVTHQGNPSGTSLNFIRIRKQKYICKHCGRTELASLSDVKKNDHIFSSIKSVIALQVPEDMSMTLIGKLNHVSSNTVYRAIAGLEEYLKPNYHFLPSHIAFDDFSSGRFSKSGMSILLVNIENHRTLDVIKDRGGNNLEKYFMRYEHKVRAAVSTVTVDLFSPYRPMIKRMFPNATILADHFHVAVQVYEALKRVRIHVMKEFPKDSRERRQLKKFWKLIMKYESDLDNTVRRKRANYRGALLTDNEVVQRLLTLSPMLKDAYDFYQDILFAMHKQDMNLLKRVLWPSKDDLQYNISDEMKKAKQTLRRHFEEIKNSFIDKNQSFTNGPVEGCNNKIKTIKKTAYGFRNFNNFRIRILVAFSTSFYALNYKNQVKEKAVKPPIGDLAA